MNETSIKPINSVRPSDAGTTAKPPVTSQAETTAIQKTVDSDPDTTTKLMDDHSGQGEKYSNVSIHFRVDDKTNELTIFVVDRKTKRVLRSIPASELNKLQAGELLKLTA